MFMFAPALTRICTTGKLLFDAAISKGVRPVLSTLLMLSGVLCISAVTLSGWLKATASSNGLAPPCAFADKK